ncbi:MAG: nucleotide sugar dehydrogenase [Anaerolineae bacterium]
MKNICVIGTGYVGLVTGTCFADLGNNVICIDIDESKIAKLLQGIMPIYEPGLEEMVRRNASQGRLHFTLSYEEGISNSDFIFICVDTPSGTEGEADLNYVRDAARGIGGVLDHPVIIVNRSTVPIGTGDIVANVVRRHLKQPVDVAVVSNPEFTREGSAVNDFLDPDRVVLGATDKDAVEAVAQLYLPLRAPIIVTDLRTAEMIKYASNAFLATRLSFINEIASICEQLGADIKEVAAGMGYDKRIGHAYLDAGIGWGGSCFTADESTFTLDGECIVVKPFAELFASFPETEQRGEVEIATPRGMHTLAFDLDSREVTLANIKCLTRRWHEGPFVEIKSRMGRRLRLTADHPVVLYQPGSDTFRSTLARNVRPGDQLVAVSEMPSLVSPDSINLLQKLSGTYLEAITKVRPRDDYFTRVYPDNEDVMRLLGYYVAEGWISLDEGRNGAIRERVGFAFGAHETEYIADLHGVLERFGFKFRAQRSGSSHSTIISSKPFAFLLRAVLGCGTCSDDKNLPQFVFNVSPPLKLAFLQGLFSGDGAITLLNQGRNFIYEYATVSKPLADGVVLLLQSLGVVPSLRKRWMNKSRQPAYIVRVNGISQLEYLKGIFGPEKEKQIDALIAGYQKRIAQFGFRREGEFITLPVMEVKREHGAEYVYSMETETGTLVASSGLVVHNCFPKDVKALAHMAAIHGTHPQLLRAVMEINRDRRRQVIRKLRNILGALDDATIGILGLSFKPNTDDMREAPSVEIIHMLQHEGAQIKAYDPVAMENAHRQLDNVSLCEDAYRVAEGSDALIIATEWNEFKQLDLARIRDLMRRPVIIDGRNIYEPDQMAELGFVYQGMGRGYDGTGRTEWEQEIAARLDGHPLQVEEPV